jgi:ribosomal protein S20
VVAKKFDQAAAKGLIHDNAAARTKSRLVASVKALKNKGASA